jgi:tRNA (adenine22-N1)-methyltransferase
MNLTNQELLLGPYLMKYKTEIFIKKWTNEIKEWQRIIEQLNKITFTTEVQQKKAELEQKIAIVEGTL